mgnify:CR=1 FL=1
MAEINGIMLKKYILNILIVESRAEICVAFEVFIIDKLKTNNIFRRNENLFL